MIGSRSIVCGCLIALAFVLPAPANAQDADLDRVAELMAEGRFGSARSVLEAWMDTAESEAPWLERQRGTWLRAVLTIDPQMAERDLRRLVVEFRGGPFSDRALHRLALGAQARSDDARALEYLRALLRDYPESPLQAEARSLSAQIEDTLSNP